MTVIIDAMGGDNAPLETVKGVALASLEYDADLVLVGKTEEIGEILESTEADMSRISIVDAQSVITMEDDPMSVVRSKKDSSMATGLRMLAENGDAFVSAGNTGALHVGASLIVRSAKCVERAAIATILPFEKPMILMDSGANVTVKPEYFTEWALMGSIYMKNVMGVEKPTVGLLNNGTEDHKGTPVEIEAYKLLSEDKRIDFIGNVEAKDLMSSPCDVIITDGFTGNVVLKTIEGLSKFFLKQLKGVFLSGSLTKLLYLFVKNKLKGMKKSFDSSEYGGAPLLGLKKPVIKAHGSTDALGIKNAIRQAIAFSETGVAEKIITALTDAEETGIKNVK